MKILIVYDSKYGFTEKCVKVLSKKLDGEVKIVNLKVDKVIDINSYDKVIIGGSVYMGMLRKRVKKFCLKNSSILCDKEIGLFITCSSIGEIALKQLKANFPEELYNKSVAKDYFGGEMNIDKAKFFDRIIIKKVSKGDKNSERSHGMDVNRINHFANIMNEN